MNFVQGINDDDINGFMACVMGLDPKAGLDLVLHTPGGDIGATEAIVNYLRSKFGSGIRAIVPQIAMSGGTMIACACESIVMGKQSSLGPVDPQIMGIAAQAIIDEYQRAKAEIKASPESIPIWQVMFGRLAPGQISLALQAQIWAKKLVTSWLDDNMLQGATEGRIEEVFSRLTEFKDQPSHSRHIGVDEARSIGLTIVDLEADQDLQDLVLAVHHSQTISLTQTGAVKIIENHLGKAYIRAMTRPS